MSKRTQRLRALKRRDKRRRNTCRRCRFCAPSGQCLDRTVRVGRCGDWVYYLLPGNKQWRRRWVRPKDPRTPAQLQNRKRLGAISRSYSAKLTTAEQKACIAAGAKRRTRPRLGQSGTLTGQQYLVHKGYATKANRPSGVQKYSHKPLQTQGISAPTWGPHRDHTGITPGQHRPHTGPGRKDAGRGNNEERRRKQAGLASEVQQNQGFTTTRRCRGASRGRTFPVSKRHRWRRRRGQGVVNFLPQHRTRPVFGTFIKELRTRRRIGLREFCLEHGHDPSNWSKLEREVLQPPQDERTLRAWARQLGLKPASEDWLKFFDYAAVGAGRIPGHILENKELAAHLPAFFRALSGGKPSRQDTEKLLAVIKGARRP